MKFALTLMLALAPTLAFAGTKEDAAKIDATLKACMEKEENQSTLGMKVCTGEALDSADKLLNKVYGEIVANLKKKASDKITRDQQAETLKRLVESQRAWVTYRDANAAFHGVEMLGGTGEGLVSTGSAYEMTKARVIEIDQVVLGTN